MTTTDSLIEKLKNDLKPVKPQMPPNRFLAVFFLISVGLAMVMAFLFKVRGDFSQVLIEGFYFPRILLSLAIVATSLLLSAWLSNPGRNLEDKGFVALGVLFAGFFAFLGVMTFVFHPEDLPGGLTLGGLPCTTTTVIVALLTTLVVGYFVRKRLVLRPTLSGLITGLGGLGAGLITIDLHCNFDNSAHVGVYHLFLPLIIMGALGSLLGFFFFRQKKINL